MISRLLRYGLSDNVVEEGEFDGEDELGFGVLRRSVSFERSSDGANVGVAVFERYKSRLCVKTMFLFNMVRCSSLTKRPVSQV